ncbi:MAG: hypothetical protein EOM21_18680 [Gammaproteobacteria bacterium]|nr:hypothetical protein [Gammaproteobacteria bacterium]
MHRNSQRGWWAVVASLLLPLLLLVGCGQQSTQSLAVGTNVWPGYEPGHIAASEGLFGDAPLRMRQFNSATEVLRAFRNDAIDVAALTIDEVLQLAQDGMDVVVILVTNISDGADAILAHPELESVSALSGRRVAVENTALGAYLLARALSIHGVDPARVEILSITVDESVAVYTAGRADAVVTFEPFRAKLLEAGARQIFSSAEMPNEIVDVLVTRRSILEAEGKTLRALVTGWLAAIELIRTEPDRAGLLMAKRLDLAPADALASFAGLRLPDAAANRAMLDGPDPELRIAARRISTLLADKGLIAGEADVDGLFEGRLIPES